MELINIYSGDIDTIVFSITDSEESNPIEKENSEKEEFKEKDKISQCYDDESISIIDKSNRVYPEFHIHNSIVFLECNTQPPEV